MSQLFVWIIHSIWIDSTAFDLSALSPFIFASGFPWDHNFTSPMLFPILPISFILMTVGENEFSEAILQVVLIVSDVDPAIRPSELPFPVHFVLFPSAFVHASVFPAVHALSLHPVVHEVTRVLDALLLFIVPFSLLFAVLEVPDIRRAIRPV